MDINMIYIWYHKAATVTAINRIFIGLHTPRPLARQRMINGENHGTPAAASIGRHDKRGRFFLRIFLYMPGKVGRESGRVRVSQYVSISVVAVSLNKKQTRILLIKELLQ